MALFCVVKCCHYGYLGGKGRASDFEYTWTPKVCKIMAFMAVIMGLGLLCYILLGFRQGLGFKFLGAWSPQQSDQALGSCLEDYRV